MSLRLADYCGIHLAQRATSMRDIWALDGDLADSDGAIHFAECHPDRFLMSGIAEQTMIFSCGWDGKLRPTSVGLFICCFSVLPCVRPN